MAAASNELITLNVGGKLFRTTRATLTKHPDSMLAAMFRGDMQASGVRDEQGHPFLDRDPTHFPFILAYLRDGRVPPLPQGLLELQQLRVEAEFFAMVELAEAAAAAAVAVQALCTSQRQLEVVRAAVVQAAHQQVERAQEEHRLAEAALAPMLTAQQVHAQAVAACINASTQDDDQAQLEAYVRLETAASMLKDARKDFCRNEQAERIAAQRLRHALLARLCALGADLPAAEAQLRATHPDLANCKFDE